MQKQNVKKKNFKKESHYEICVYDTCHGFEVQETIVYFDRKKDSDEDVQRIWERSKNRLKYKHLIEEEEKK